MPISMRGHQSNNLGNKPFTTKDTKEHKEKEGEAGHTPSVLFLSRMLQLLESTIGVNSVQLTRRAARHTSWPSRWLEAQEIT